MRGRRSNSDSAFGRELSEQIKYESADPSPRLVHGVKIVSDAGELEDEDQRTNDGGPVEAETGLRKRRATDRVTSSTRTARWNAGPRVEPTKYSSHGVRRRSGSVQPQGEYSAH